MCTDTHNGGVLCTDSLTEQHEHQTQGRGSVYRETQRATSTPNPGEGHFVQTDSQGRGIMYRQPHRGGVLCTVRLTGNGHCV